jgi:hypothetical protein
MAAGADSYSSSAGNAQVDIGPQIGSTLNSHADSTRCARPGCENAGEWQVTLAPTELVEGPAWLSSDSLALCQGCLNIIRAWGWAVEIDARPTASIPWTSP